MGCFVRANRGQAMNCLFGDQIPDVKPMNRSGDNETDSGFYLPTPEEIEEGKKMIEIKQSKFALGVTGEENCFDIRDKAIL